jgi:UDP-N-acetylmuramate--alanine ligase
LIEGIKKAGHPNVIKLSHENDLAKIIKPLIKANDLIFCTGAGTISAWANNLQKQLEKL